MATTSYYRPYTTEPVEDGCISPFKGTEQPARQPNIYPSGKGQYTTDGHGDEDPLDKYSITELDEDGNEIKYRETVHLMGGDIVAMRTQVRELEGLNSHLRQDLASYSNTSRLMVDDAELSGLTKPEVFRRYATIKKTLAIQKAELKNYKKKLQEGQNELIKKNEREKSLLELQRSCVSQQLMLKTLQERLIKMRKLEEACQKQESVIQQMEKVLERHQRAKSRSQKDQEAEEAHEVLLKENKRLKEQIEELRIQLQSSSSRSGDDLEKLELYQKIEKAHERIAALENQLAEDSRAWGKEREGMIRKMNEAEHGFGRSTGMVLHDFSTCEIIFFNQTV